MTRTSAAIVLILTVATLFVPLAAFAYSSDKKDVTTIAPHDKSIAQTDLKVPANASDHPGISVISLAGQSNNNNQLAACTSKPSQERGTAPPFCNGHLVVVKHVINDDGGTSSAGDFTISVSRSSPGKNHQVLVSH
jgi:hypothetical protein